MKKSCPHGPNREVNTQGRCKACHNAAQKIRRDRYNAKQRASKLAQRMSLSSRPTDPAASQPPAGAIRISTGYQHRYYLLKDLSKLWHQNPRQGEAFAREIMQWERANAGKRPPTARQLAKELAR